MNMHINCDLIKKLRIGKSWSQEQLAEYAGLSLRTVQRVESEGVASLQSRKAIADALEVAPSMLDAETGAVINQNTLSDPDPDSRHSITTESLPGYYSMKTMRLLLMGGLWSTLMLLALASAILILGSIFFWEYTTLTAFQSIGAGIITTLMLTVPPFLVFHWAYKNIKRIEVLGPASQEAEKPSNA